MMAMLVLIAFAMGILVERHAVPRRTCRHHMPTKRYYGRNW